MSCPAAKSVTHIENSDHRKGSSGNGVTLTGGNSDLGSLPYRLLHYGVTRTTTSSTSPNDGANEDDRLLYLQILESLIRGTNSESWSPAIRSILSQTILTHLHSHFIHFNHPSERLSPLIFSALLTTLCSCLLSPEASSLSESNEQHTNNNSVGTITKKTLSSNHTHLISSSSSLSLPELIQWIDDRYLSQNNSGSPSPSPVLLSALYSFLSRISFYGATEKFYSHHNRKLYSTLFAHERIFTIMMNCLEPHLLPSSQHTSMSTSDDQLTQVGLVTLWIVLYSSEGMRGKWKKMANELKKKNDFDWKYFLTTFLLESPLPPEGRGRSGAATGGGWSVGEESDEKKNGKRESENGNEEKKEKGREITLSDRAILAITNLISES
jgi:hypothetical protein